MRTFVLFDPLVLGLVLGISALGCGSRSQGADSPPQCREDVVDDTKMGVKTGAEGAKTGVTTAVEGVKTFGSATAGLVEGGKDEAKERWNKGADQTRQTARKGAQDTKKESSVPRCR